MTTRINLAVKTSLTAAILTAIALTLITNTVFASHWDKDHDDNDNKGHDRGQISVGQGSGINIVNSNKNENSNENKNTITINNSTQPVSIAAVPRVSPATGSPLLPTLALFGTIPLGLKLARFKAKGNDEK